MACKNIFIALEPTVKKDRSTSSLMHLAPVTSGDLGVPNADG
ncbi:hypothetical protein [Pseudomonas fluorescens]|nr:hypothetical protein [Pseudomonas fluorescens]